VYELGIEVIQWSRPKQLINFLDDIYKYMPRSQRRKVRRTDLQFAYKYKRLAAPNGSTEEQILKYELQETWIGILTTLPGMSVQRARYLVLHHTMSCPISAFCFVERMYKYDNSSMNSKCIYLRNSENQTIDELKALLEHQDSDGKRRKKPKLASLLFRMLSSSDSNLPLRFNGT